MRLVTGATGHIGNVLVRQLLARGEKVRVLIQRGSNRQPLKGLVVEAVEGDVLDMHSVVESMRGVHTVFHLAGLISIMPGRNPLVRRVNVEGTKNFLRAAREQGVKKFVYTSSMHAIQRVAEGVIAESLPYDPDNPYGDYDCSQADATPEVQKAAQAGLQAVITCPTGVIGPYDFRGSLMGEVIRSAAQQKPTLYVDGIYDFVDVRDVAAGLISAAERGRRGESYILSGEQLSMSQLLATVRASTGHSFFQIKIPFSLARLAARCAPFYYRLAGAWPRFTPHSLEVLQNNSDISHAKATRELGYHPRPLSGSIAESAGWYLTSEHAELDQELLNPQAPRRRKN